MKAEIERLQGSATKGADDALTTLLAESALARTVVEIAVELEREARAAREG